MGWFAFRTPKSIKLLTFAMIMMFMPAKRKGVITGQAIWQARQVCPNLQTVSPDFEEVLRYSGWVRRIFARYTNRVQPFGVDEAWLDVSGPGVEIDDGFRMLSLYLHFPFCKRKCSYCDFCSAAATDQAMEQYCDALAVEIALQAARYGGEPVDTVFLGGGTPSLVPAPAMRKVLTALRRNFHILSDAECSSEANPGTLTDAWLDVATEAGVNRLSIGVQAKQTNLLRTLERIHTYPQALEALRMAREHGIENLNTDAMFGLPGQTLDDYLETLNAFVDEHANWLWRTLSRMPFVCSAGR